MHCGNPFNNLILSSAVYNTCCQDWQDPEVIPSIATKDPWEIWNHKSFQKLRKSILDGSYQYCQKCPGVIGETLKATKFDDHKVVMERGPRVLRVSNDFSCNLHCWSCRKKVEMYPRDEDKIIFLQNMLGAFKDDLNMLSLLHSGDPFASPTYRPFLQELNGRDYPNLVIHIFSNGNLMPKYWDSIKKIHTNIRSLEFSIDAATEETYKIMRLGGRWDWLQDALKLVKRLRKYGFVNHAKASFVVTTRNFREMPAFAKMAVEHGFNSVSFGQLRLWSINPDFYKKQNVCDPSHPMYEELLEVIDDPWMKHPAVFHFINPKICDAFTSIDQQRMKEGI